ncbi:MAG: FHA domain-containing protein, partial [Planctomycetota bacterium]
MSAVATDRFHGSTAATEILVLEPVAQRLGLAPILLEPGEITIGSSPDCQVQLTAAGVQDHHCVLVCAGSRVSLRALDRRTWHNNLPISGGWLRVGDRLAIGPVEFRVRQAESGEIASANSSSVDSPGAADVPVTARQKQFEQGRVKVFESQLLQEIAGLEAEVARHQSAVNRLEQQAAPVADPAVPADLGSASVSRPTSGKLEPTARPEFSSPQFHLRAATTGSGEVQPGALLDDVETQSRQARRQLAELAVREAAIQRQGLELETQWDQLRELIAEQDAATAERSEREQQLQEREQRCAFQETEIARRSQGLSEQLENATARLQQLQTETDQLGQQSAQLTEREKSLADFSHQLNAREAELEQIRIALVEQEATHRDAAEAGQSWQQLRDATESRWALRAQELDTQVSLQQSQADALVRREQACEQLEAEVRHGRQQLLADQTHLDGWKQELTQLQATLDGHLQEHETRQGTWQSREAELQSRAAAHEHTAVAIQRDREHFAAEQIRLQTWNDELTQSQSVFTHQQQELAVEAATIKAEAHEFVLREYAWEQIVSSTQRDRERLEAEREQLEALRGELHTRQSELTERQLQLESQESSRKAQLDDFVQREHGLEQAIADLQQDEDRLVAEEQRLTAWDAQLFARQSQVDEHHQNLTVRTTLLTEQTAELSQREQAWEQTSNNTTEVEGQLLAERSRLEAWLAELSALHAALTTDRQELETRQTAWTETRRSEAESVSTALTNEYSSLAQMRDELALTEHRLEQADADLSDLEVELRARDEELRAREHALHQAEMDCAWQQRECELHLGSLVPVSFEDAAVTDTDVSE